MSTAKVDIGESNFPGKELLPLESFVSPTNSTPEDQFTSGYDYFIDEMIACVKTREIGGGDAGDGLGESMSIAPLEQQLADPQAQMYTMRL